ncbi:MAG TPA: sigma-54 dependent transcriptional regulator [Polyangiaceae bacterium]|nr:sigma-54 dependent transcriptional regulator [Polyangiaceae bacterium]
MTTSYRPPPRAPSLRPRTTLIPEPFGVKDKTVRVLLVDDEPNIRRSLARVLMSEGFDVMTAEDGQAAVALLETGAVDVMLVDMQMPRMGGMDLLNRVKAHHPEVEVIMMTAHANVDDAVAAVKNGAYDFLPKPFPSNDVVAMTISKAAERKQLLDRMNVLEQRLEQQENFGELIGNTAAMREVYRLALGVAPTSATVLVLGESGTGKELIARAIHQHSNRADRPFLAINCSAIPVDLVESELFGHVRGAFTGAVSARVGLFEAADKGTVFLDEVGDLPLQAQVKLLRALQEGEVKRVGSNETVTVDCRVIAATNADLKTKIAEGRFREDLYYRLHVVVIRVPPLRRRRDDVPLLAYHFLRKYARRMERDVARIGVEAMRLLRDQKWPGNVRELEHAIEHAVVMAKGDTIVPGDLPSNKEHGTPNYDEDASIPQDEGEMLPDLGDLTDLPYARAKKQALEIFEQAYLEAVLRRTGGNVSEAARQAGLDRSNFRRVLKKADVRKKPVES